MSQFQLEQSREEVEYPFDNLSLLICLMTYNVLIKTYNIFMEYRVCGLTDLLPAIIPNSSLSYLLPLSQGPSPLSRYF